MPTYANNITQLCQQAAKVYLDSEELSFVADNETQIVTGIFSDDLTLTTVVCQCQNADAAVPYEGNWSATLRIELRNNADDVTADEHHAMAGELFSKFMVSVADGRLNLSNQTLGFTCQQLLPTQQGWEINDGSWVSFLLLQVECCGTYFATT